MAALTVEFPQTVWTVEFGGDEIVVAPVTMAPGAPGGGGGGAVDSVNGQSGVVVLGLDDLTDVDTTTDPPDAEDVLAWDGVMWTPATLAALGAPGLSNAAPHVLGTAAAGVATEASRADHVHAMPSAADVGAAASAHVHTGADITSGTVGTARLGSGTADATTFLRGDGAWAGVPDEVPTITPIVQVGYYSQPGPYTNSHASLIAVQRASWTAIWLGPGTYDAIGIWVSTTSTTTLRLCVDTVGADGLPDALVRDAGTVDCSTTTGLRMLTFGSTLTITESTWYWCRVVCTAYTSPPSLSCLNATGGNSWPPWPGMGDSASFSNRAVAGFFSTAQPTGPDENPATADSLQGAASVRVWLRRSA